MIYIENLSNDPRYNLALEEYVLKNMIDDDFVLLWQNEPSVIIGRFQNTIEEINRDYIQKTNINVVRRITGGGAVYHDLGNLNFSFIQSTGGDTNNGFEKYTAIIIKALEQMDIKAAFTGRNDITIDGKKVSGNAQFRYKDRILHHGTLLFNSNLENVQRALRVKTSKIESKGIKSVRSRVANIADYIKEEMTLEDFKSALLKSLFSGFAIRRRQLTEEENIAVNKLMNEKYASWEWNYGASPDFDIVCSGHFACGHIEFCIKMSAGVIDSCKIYGDFLGSGDMAQVESSLVGTRYEEGALKEKIERLDLWHLFGQVDSDEIITCLLLKGK